jgi:ribonuclease Z
MNGHVIVVGGDTFPNKWYIKHATDADIAIHEVFLTPEDLVKLYGQSPGQALGVGTQIHTSPQVIDLLASHVRCR